MNSTKSDPFNRNHGYKILVMDDEDMIRKVITKILEANGYTVDSASDGKQAIELYSQALKTRQPYVCTILDLNVPGGMGGKDTLLELLRIDPKCKAIVTSGDSTDQAVLNYTDFGFKGIAIKPFIMEELLTELNRVLQL